MGEAWIWSPSWLQVFEKVKIRIRRTFNSSTTPSVGEMRVEPQRLAAVDLDAIGAKMRETMERAKENDPVALKAELKRLRRELDEAKAAKPIEKR